MQLSIEKDIEILNEIIDSGWLISDLDKCTAIDACEDAITALKQYHILDKNCDDAISRQAVINLVVANHTELNGLNVVMYAPFYKDIIQLPSVISQPKTGHWVEENISEGCRKVFCSECGCPPPFEHISTGDVYSASGYGVINKTKHCPNCGVKMESEVKENG